MRFSNEKDPGDPIMIYRVVKEFTMGSILYAVGVTRLWTGHEVTIFVADLQRTFCLKDYAHGCEFFNEHFDPVKQ